MLNPFRSIHVALFTSFSLLLGELFQQVTVEAQGPSGARSWHDLRACALIYSFVPMVPKIAKKCCHDWVQEEQQRNPDAYTLSRALPPCPCTLQQAEHDELFVRDRFCDNARTSFKCRLRADRKAACFVTRKPLNLAGQECCYENSETSTGQLISQHRLISGSIQRRHTNASGFQSIWGDWTGSQIESFAKSHNIGIEHYLEDIIPYEWCCELSDTTCQGYHELRPTDDCSRYKPPTTVLPSTSPTPTTRTTTTPSTTTPRTTTTPLTTTTQPPTTTTPLSCSQLNCENGGSCKANATTGLHMCSCRPGFLGARCETRMLQFKVTMKFTEIHRSPVEFDSELRDSGSKRFRSVSKNVCNVTRTACANVSGTFCDCEVLGFRKGSIVADVKVSAGETGQKKVNFADIKRDFPEKLKSTSVRYITIVDVPIIEDFDECAAKTHDCSPDAICTNTELAYTCACKPGFRDVTGSPPGMNCKCTSAYCSNHGECINRTMRRTSTSDNVCQCHPGYRGSRCNILRENEEKSSQQQKMIYIGAACGAAVVLLIVVLVSVGCHKYKSDRRKLDSEMEMEMHRFHIPRPTIWSTSSDGRSSRNHHHCRSGGGGHPFRAPPPPLHRSVSEDPSTSLTPNQQQRGLPVCTDFFDDSSSSPDSTGRRHSQEDYDDMSGVSRSRSERTRSVSTCSVPVQVANQDYTNFAAVRRPEHVQVYDNLTFLDSERVISSPFRIHHQNPADCTNSSSLSHHSRRVTPARGTHNNTNNNPPSYYRDDGRPLSTVHSLRSGHYPRR